MSRKDRVGTCYTRAWVTSHSPMQAVAVAWCADYAPGLVLDGDAVRVLGDCWELPCMCGAQSSQDKHL